MGFPANLLGGHVGDGARDLSFQVALRLLRDREAKVRNVRGTMFVEQNIARLEVAMVDAPLMGVVQGLGHAADKFKSSLDGKSLPSLRIFQAILQRLAW